MDFLDPTKQKAHNRRLAFGYIIIGLVILLATTILLYQAFGYGVDRSGRIIKNGLVFVSSVPANANIYIDGKLENNATNTRLTLPAGQYIFELKRDGYRTWKRVITVEGGTVQRFDYPFLFPNSLDASTTKQYESGPSLVSQSFDLRWLFVGIGGDALDLYDLDADKPTPKSFTIPAEVLSAGTVTTGWQEVEWSDDNRHVVLRRTFDNNGQPGSEYVLVDRQDAAASVNLSIVFGFTPTTLQLRDGDYDKYLAFDQPNGSLFTATLDKPTPQLYLSNVLDFESEGADRVLYATSEEAPEGKTLIRIRDGDKRYTIRQVNSDSAPYALDLKKFEDDWYVVAGASGENKTYIYRNPVKVLKSNDGNVLAPLYILKTTNPSYVSFAPGARFVVAENGTQFATYDIKTSKGYAYQLGSPVDSAAGHATWMDGYHLQVVSGGNVLVFDYDGTNNQSLASSTTSILPYFDKRYRRLYTFTTENALISSELRTSEDR